MNLIKNIVSIIVFFAVGALVFFACDSLVDSVSRDLFVDGARVENKTADDSIERFSAFMRMVGYAEAADILKKNGYTEANQCLKLQFHNQYTQEEIDYFMYAIKRNYKGGDMECLSMK